LGLALRSVSSLELKFIHNNKKQEFGNRENEEREREKADEVG